MARTWTPEQREEARQRAIKSGLGRKASVSDGPSAEQLLMAKAEGTPAVQTREDLADVVDKDVLQDDSGHVDHTKPGRVAVYKPTPLGYRRRDIPVTNLGMALRNGFLPKCPDCGGECGYGMNDCPGRPKRLYRVCTIPGCGHRVYDFQAVSAEEIVENPDDPSLIQDDAYLNSTPESRTKAMMDKHKLARHPTEAAAEGIMPTVARQEAVR